MIVIGSVLHIRSLKESDIPIILIDVNTVATIILVIRIGSMTETIETGIGTVIIIEKRAGLKDFSPADHRQLSNVGLHFLALRFQVPISKEETLTQLKIEVYAQKYHQRILSSVHLYVMMLCHHLTNGLQPRCHLIWNRDAVKYSLLQDHDVLIRDFNVRINVKMLFPTLITVVENLPPAQIPDVPRIPYLNTMAGGLLSRIPIFILPILI